MPIDYFAATPELLLRRENTLEKFPSPLIHPWKLGMYPRI